MPGPATPYELGKTGPVEDSPRRERESGTNRKGLPFNRTILTPLKYHFAHLRLLGSQTALSRDWVITRGVCLVPTEDLEGWCDVEHGGDGWRVEELPGDCGVEFIHDESVKKFFASSFE